MEKLVNPKERQIQALAGGSWSPWNPLDPGLWVLLPGRKQIAFQTFPPPFSPKAPSYDSQIS